MYVLVTYKNEEDQMKNESTRMVKTLLSYILDTQGQLTIVAGQVWPKIKLVKVFTVVLDTCKNDEDPPRNESIRVLTTLLK